MRNWRVHFNLERVYQGKNNDSERNINTTSSLLFHFSSVQSSSVQFSSQSQFNISSHDEMWLYRICHPQTIIIQIWISVSVSVFCCWNVAVTVRMNNWSQDFCDRGSIILKDWSNLKQNDHAFYVDVIVARAFPGNQKRLNLLTSVLLMWSLLTKRKVMTSFLFT